MFLKEKTILPTILFLFVVILLILIFTSNTYVPYSDVLVHNYSAYDNVYEGLETKEEGNGNVKANTVTVPVVSADVKTVTIKKDTNPSGNVKASGNTNSENTQADTNTESFENMYSTVKWGYAPINMKADLDKFGDIVHVPHSGTCFSAGLFTSHGPLCLTPELKKLLETRGDNI
jgi:hypothetical protein